MRNKLDFSRCSNSGQKLISRFGEMVLNPFFMGELVLVSGNLVACDPLVFPGTKAFSPKFQPGRYPVNLSVAYDKKNDSYMVAYSTLCLSEQIPINWKLATRSDEDLNLLPEGKKFGFGVDSGTACFMDADVAEIIVDTAWEAQTYEETWASKLEEELEKNRYLGCQWINLCVDDHTGGNIIAFESGLGDGFYSSYFGYDTEGNIVQIVTEFLSGDLPIIL